MSGTSWTIDTREGDPIAAVVASADALSTSQAEGVPTLAVGPPSLLEFLDPALCDDYLAEPWTAQELRFRLGRIVRSQSVRFAGGVITLQGSTLVAVSGRGSRSAAELSGSESALFRALARTPHVPVHREVLVAVSGGAGASRSLDMRISRLRRKLGTITREWRLAPYLRSVRGRGYTLSE